MASRLLGELGAEVIKIEPESGDFLRSAGPLRDQDRSYAFLLANPGKKSIALAADEARSRDRFYDLVRSSDVIIDNHPQGKVGWLGVSWETTLAANPAALWCSITPYGLTGPLSRHVGSDLVAQAVGGIMATNGYEASPHVRAGFNLAETTGAIVGTNAILAALLFRSRSGRGQLIDISLQDCMISVAQFFFAYYLHHGNPSEKRGHRHVFAGMWNMYQAADGYLVFNNGSEESWKQICELLERPRLIADQRFQTSAGRMQYQSEIDALLANWLKDKAVADAIQTCEHFRLASGPVWKISDVVNSAHLSQRGMLIRFSGDGDSPTIGSMFKFSDGAGEVQTPAPRLGEHNNNTFEDIRERRRPERKKDESSSSNSPLDGLIVIDYTRGTAGPQCARQLANLGATVIRPEAPRRGNQGSSLDTDGNVGYFVNNCDKRNISLNMRSDKGRELLLRLADLADVWIENAAPGSLDRHGLGYKDLAKRNPALVYCSISGFGHSGELSRKRAYDGVIQGMSGTMSVTGWPDEPEVKVGASIADVVSGIFASGAIMGTLLRRNETGRGQHVDVSMQDVTTWLAMDAWIPFLSAGVNPARLGNRGRLFAPDNAYEARDGQVVISVTSEAQWERFRKLIDGETVNDTRFGSNADRMKNVVLLDQIIAKWCASKLTATISDLCRDAGVPASPVMELSEIVNDPHVAAREVIVERTHPKIGKVRLTNSLYRMSESPGRVRTPGSIPGEHNDEIYEKMLGLTADEMAALRAAGTI